MLISYIRTCLLAFSFYFQDYIFVKVLRASILNVSKTSVVIMNYYLGVDTAKINYAASLINSNGVIKFINSNVDLNKLLSTLQNKLGNLNNIEIAMETIGYYLLSLYSALINNSFNVFCQ